MKKARKKGARREKKVQGVKKGARREKKARDARRED